MSMGCCLQVRETDAEFKITVQGANAVELHVTMEPFGLTLVSCQERSL